MIHGVFSGEPAIELLDETWEQIRLVARDLRPPALDALGLNDTLHDFCARFAERTQLEISYQGVAMTDLADAHEITLTNPNHVLHQHVLIGHHLFGGHGGDRVT